MKSLLVIGLTASLLGASVTAAAAPETLNGLLEQVRGFSAADKVTNQKREQAFNQDLAQKRALLSKSRDRLALAEAEQERLKEAFDANDLLLAEKEAQLTQRAGQLGEVFGVAKEKAAELRPLLADSLVSAQYPDRDQVLTFADSKRVPTLQDLEALWYQLQLEMTASGQISQFSAPVIGQDGQQRELAVTRFGVFSAAAEDLYLQWDAEQQTLAALPTQPRQAASQLEAYASGTAAQVTIDPSRGQLFMLLDREPRLLERIQQGGNVGYLILALGALGLLVSLYQVLRMVMSEIKVAAQLRRPEKLSVKNALGRVLLAAQQTGSAEQRELKVDEAILQELPGIERGQSFVKLLAAVAPLLGLLGTVIGMIATFQSITLFGTSDPKLMAGGISQALMTTVLGLVVAIPLLFCHSYLATRSRRLTQILQEKSLGLLAEPVAAAPQQELPRAA